MVCLTSVRGMGAVTDGVSLQGHWWTISWGALWLRAWGAPTAGG